MLQLNMEVKTRGVKVSVDVLALSSTDESAALSISNVFFSSSPELTELVNNDT